MAIVVGHEVSGKTYGTAALESGAAKSAKETRERNAQRQFQRETQIINAKLNEDQAQRNFERQSILLDKQNQSAIERQAALKQIDLDAKLQEKQQEIDLRKEIEGSIDPYGSINISEALASQPIEYDYSANPKLQKQADQINKGMITLDQYLSNGLFDNRMDEYKVLKAQLTNQLDTINRFAKPIQNIADEFGNNTLSYKNPSDGNTYLIQKDRYGKFIPVIKNTKKGGSTDTWDSIDTKTKLSLVNDQLKAVGGQISNQEAVEKAKQLFESVSNLSTPSGTATGMNMADLPTDIQAMLPNFEAAIGRRITQEDVDDLVSKGYTPLQLQEFIRKRNNMKFLQEQAGYNLGTP